MSVTTCPSCNTSVPPGAVFCDNCGYDLRTVSAPSEAPVQATYQVSPPEDDLNCPKCGHANIAGSAFCENCGSQLALQPAAPPTPAPVTPPPTPAPETPPPPVAPAAQPQEPELAPEPPPPAPPSAISGHFVIPDGDITLQIPSGKQTVIIGREDPVSGIFPDIDLDQHGGQDAGVGRRHAQLILQGGQVFIEDLDSVNGTVLNRQKIAPRQPQPINDGDEIRLGKMVLIFHSE